MNTLFNYFKKANEVVDLTNEIDWDEEFVIIENEIASDLHDPLYIYKWLWAI